MTYLDSINVVILVASIANVLFGLTVYSRNRRNATSSAFFFLSIAIMAWGIVMVLFRSTTSTLFATYSAAALYASAALIPLFSVRFAQVFPDQTPGRLFRSRKDLLHILPGFLMFLCAAIPGVLVVYAEPRFGDTEAIIHFNLLVHTLYVFYTVFFFLWAQTILIQKYLRGTDAVRHQLFYIISGTMITILIAGTTNLFLPFLGIFRFNWVGQIATTTMTGLIAYGVLRYRVFNIRLLSTELLMFFLWLMVFSNIMIADTLQSKLFNLSIFMLILVAGLLLIRSIVQEVRARDRIQELAENLEAANKHLREIDRQKSEFLSIASHQLRTPLAAIKGYASLMLENAYGALSDEMRKPVDTIFSSSARMADTVNDFLNVSRIEQGKMEYRIIQSDLESLVKNAAEELQVSAKSKGLDLSYVSDGTGPYMVNMDTSKIEHVVSNLIDNAIKYTPHGSVSVTLGRHPERSEVYVAVTDTGAGIPPDALHTLFDKFVRARNAKEINVTGTGLGLYVAKEMARAHGGTIVAASEGEGRGATFTLTLPLAGSPQGTSIRSIS